MARYGAKTEKTVKEKGKIDTHLESGKQNSVVKFDGVVYKNLLVYRTDRKILSYLISSIMTPKVKFKTRISIVNDERETGTIVMQIKPRQIYKSIKHVIGQNYIFIYPLYSLRLVKIKTN